MIITTDQEGWYENLVNEHERKAAEAPYESGLRKAESIITEELKQMQRDRSLHFTIQQAITLLCARIRLRMHSLIGETTYYIEKREVYYRFLASYSKKAQRENATSILRSMQEYMYNGASLTPFQAYCVGMFVQYVAYGDDYGNAHPLISTVSIREWLVKRIDYYETLSINYQQRQDAIDAFIYILGLFH